MITDKPLMQDLGENYEYVKTIAQNNIEIKKLQLLSSSLKLAGKLSYGIVLGVIVFALFNLALVLSVVYLAQILNSTLYATLIVFVVLMFITILLLLAKSYIVKSIVDKLSSQIISE